MAHLQQNTVPSRHNPRCSLEIQPATQILPHSQGTHKGFIRETHPFSFSCLRMKLSNSFCIHGPVSFHNFLGDTHQIFTYRSSPLSSALRQNPTNPSACSPPQHWVYLYLHSCANLNYFPPWLYALNWKVPALSAPISPGSCSIPLTL